jgi:hypothetical protein
MFEFLPIYVGLCSILSYVIYLKYKSGTEDKKLLEYTFRTTAFSIQMYIVIVSFITRYITTLEQSTEDIVLALPLLAYFTFDTISMSLYYTFSAALPFLLHHTVALCVGSYGLSASGEYRDVIRVIVLLFESTAGFINLQWLLTHSKRTHNWMYMINGWIILIGFPLLRFGLYFSFLYGHYASLHIDEKYAVTMFSILISIYNVIVYPHIVGFCLPAVLPIKLVDRQK